MIDENDDDDVPADDVSISVNEEKETLPILRDERGRLLPGTRALPGAGRPPGSGARPRAIDIARRLAAKAGIAVEDALQQVFESMFVKAGKGDVGAARLIVERLTANDAEEAIAGGVPALQVLETAALAKGVAAITGEAGAKFWNDEAASLEALAAEQQKMQQGGLTEEALATYAAKARCARAVSTLCAADAALAKDRAARIEELIGDTPVS